MSVNRHRRTGRLGLLLGAAALALTAAPVEALAQQVTFPSGGAFANLTPSAGNDTITVAADNALYLPVITGGSSGTVAQDTYTKDFLGGVNTVTNNGYVFVGTESGQIITGTSFNRDNKRYEGEMRFVNLTTFNNNGAIYLGSMYQTAIGYPIGVVGSDRWHDDILSMQGAHFVGGTNSRLFLDADLNAVGQLGCSSALRSATTVSDGTLPANDCINLTGGSVSGRTLVNVTDAVPGDRGAYNPEGNVIVDLAGGDPDEISPDAFVLDPDTVGYDARSGVLDKGLFAYTVGYDPDAQQFKLYGIQSAAAHQFPLLAQVANDLWRTSAGGWFERQVDQRERDSRGGGVWGRLAFSTADRGVSASSAAGNGLVVFDNSYTQEDSALTFGADVVVADTLGGAWAVGAMVGYARTRLDFNDYDNAANLEGMHAGVYGGFTAGAFFVDAALNGLWLDLDSDVPVMDLQPDGTLLGTKIQSVGARLESGWRVRGGRFSIEPLVGLSVVRTSVDDLNVPADDPSRLGGEVAFDDATSRRASAGVRFAIEDIVPLTPTNRITLTARHGAEFDGEASASIANVGPTAAPVSDTFDGQFSELAATFTAANAAETVAGYVNFEALFGEDYDRLTASVGVRYQW